LNEYLENFINTKFEKPIKALDLGAGDFCDVKQLEKLGWKCEGVDLEMGIDLEKPYVSKNKPFDLVYSNYVLQRIKNKNVFARTVYENLKDDGCFFIHTFEKNDSVIATGMSQEFLQELLEKQGFRNIEIRIFDHYDKGHKHWHKILEASGQK